MAVDVLVKTKKTIFVCEITFFANVLNRPKYPLEKQRYFTQRSKVNNSRSVFIFSRCIYGFIGK